jgi:TPP-dependent pyruvate/acetoin dehydrogenase alpha subunit
LSEGEAAALEQAARQEIEAAVQFALESPYPELDALYSDVYA